MKAKAQVGIVALLILAIILYVVLPLCIGGIREAQGGFAEDIYPDGVWIDRGEIPWLDRILTQE